MVTRLLLAKASSLPGPVLRGMAGSTGWRWVYAGRDLTLRSLWQQRLGDMATLEDTGQALQRTAESLLPDFRQLMDRFAARYDSLGWWLGALAEKNPDVSPAFLHICYLVLVFETIQSSPDVSWLIVIESDGLRRSIARNARRRAIQVEDLTPRWRDAIGRAEAPARGVVAKMRFLLSRSRTWLLYRRVSREYRLDQPARGPQEPVIIMHSWILDGSIGPDGQFRDLYFADLASWLKGRGYEVRYLVLPATLMTRQVPAELPLRLLARSGRLGSHKVWLRWRDILTATWLPLVRSRLPRGPVHFHDWDVSAIFAEGRLDQVWSGRTSDAYLYYAWAKRLRRAGRGIHQILYTYENHVWEKALCLGVRHAGLETEVLAYQHANLPDCYSNFFPGPNEISCHTLPDRIVCCGRASRDAMAGVGYRELTVGPALRYGQMWASIPRSGSSRTTILVVLSVGWDAYELIWKAFEAFKGDASKRVLFRSHPSMRLSARDMEGLLRTALPAHFEVSPAPLTELLGLADLVVYTSSTVCYEALAQGIPVVCVEQAMDIHKDLFRRWPGIIPTAHTARELTAWAEVLIHQKPDERRAWLDKVGDLVRYTFEPVSEDRLAAFLPRKAAAVTKEPVRQRRSEGRSPGRAAGCPPGALASSTGVER